VEQLVVLRKRRRGIAANRHPRGTEWPCRVARKLQDKVKNRTLKIAGCGAQSLLTTLRVLCPSNQVDSVEGADAVIESD